MRKIFDVSCSGQIAQKKTFLLLPLGAIEGRLIVNLGYCFLILHRPYFFVGEIKNNSKIYTLLSFYFFFVLNNFYFC